MKIKTETRTIFYILVGVSVIRLLELVTGLQSEGGFSYFYSIGIIGNYWQ